MIVPHNRLLAWVAAVIVPGAALAGLLPETAPLAGLAMGAVAAAALLDAWRGRRSLEGVRVELPARVNLSKNRPSRLELRIANEPNQARPLRLLLPFPPAIRPRDEEMETRIGGCAVGRLSWPCTPVQRGRFTLSACHLETTSPWGLWAVRRTQPVQTELRVYPDLLSERKSLASLFLNRGLAGVHAQRQVGKGREFEKLREYISGDSYEDIHWKATAKRGRPVTKVFQIERTQEIYVVIDASRLSARELPSASDSLRGAGGDAWSGRYARTEGETEADTSQPALERFVTAALVLGLAAERQGDLFGVLTFADRVQRFVRAGNGQAHYRACRDLLYTVEAEAVTPDFAEVCSFVRTRLRRRALLVFLTALDDPVLAEAFAQNLELICRHHLVSVNMIASPGVAPVFGDADVRSIDDIYQKLSGHLRWHDLRELQSVLQHRGVRFSLLQNERLSAELVAQYLNVKQRQLL